MNWRKPIIYSLLYLTNSKIPRNLNELKKISKYSEIKKRKYQERKLKKLLWHAYTNIPYYRKILEDCEVINNGKVNLKKFNKIPILTKEIIRKEGKNLYSKDHKKRNSYANTSGGSTGEPVRFLQDKKYGEMNTATKIYCNDKLGKKLAEKELKLWGSDRDILKGNLSFKERLINYLYNRKFFNCYTFSDNNIKKLINVNNNFKPTSYWAYVDASFELAKYVKRNGSKFISPKFIITTIGPLSEFVRGEIENSLNTKVYNQYGSREFGLVASQEKSKKRLEVCWWRVFSETLNFKIESPLILTCLDNYSMPLIRYDVGDVIINKSKQMNVLYFDDVIGRTLGFFKKSDGSLYHTHHLVQQLFFIDWIKQFQIIQKDYEKIMIKVVIKGSEDKKTMKKIEKNIEKLAGKVTIDWKFVKSIPKTKTGKSLYTVSELK